MAITHRSEPLLLTLRERERETREEERRERREERGESRRKET